VSYERPDFFLRAWVSSYNDTSTPFTHPLLANFLRLTDANSNSTNLKTRAYTYNIETQHTLELSFSNRLSYGVNYRLNTLSSAYSHSSQENRLGFYIQDEWKATSRLTVVAGMRYDLHTEIHGTLSPRLSLLYSPAENHTFRTSVSVAYRPPTLSETHLDIRSIIIPLGVTASASGSSNLDPEQIVSYDLGYQGWFLNHRLRTRVDLFFNHISKLIETTSPTVINGKEGDIYGGETGIEFLATEWLSGFANFSYQEINQTFVGEAVKRAAPLMKWNAGIRSEWQSGLSGEVAFHHYGAVTYPLATAFASLAPLGATAPDPRVGSYNLLNIRAAYKFWQEKAEAGYVRDAEVAISAFNALDDKHKEHPLGDTIGSRVMGWITVRY
jgi:iron complex outermembrane recepter protein